MWVAWIASALTAPLHGEWERANEPKAWEFPKDHGAHRSFKTEWWYFTGHLRQGDREWGYQWTLFRQGINRNLSDKPSRWTIGDIHFAHFALSDIRADRFSFKELVSRGVMGHSSISEERMEGHIENWIMRTLSPDHYRITAEIPEDRIKFDIRLQASKPLVFQGDRGLSQKGKEPGNASHYYSYPRLASEGQITVGDQVFEVVGESWFDHEFSTSVLEEGQIGWDWFSIQLDNGHEIMIYQLRNRDGSKHPLSKGTLVLPDGTNTILGYSDFSLKSIGSWKSRETGATYPSGWKISIPSRGIELNVQPKIKDQELVLRAIADFAYWEGAGRVEGTFGGAPVKGNSYTELTGYLKPLGGELK